MAKYERKPQRYVVVRDGAIVAEVKQALYYQFVPRFINFFDADSRFIQSVPAQPRDIVKPWSIGFGVARSGFTG